MKRSCTIIAYLITIILPILLLMAGCGERPSDVRLWKLHERATVDSLANEILTSLDSIDPSALSRADRKLYELTYLKAEDKAYIIHESDSVILSLVEYYRKNPYRDLYPEALYYAGRVYCDMGDYPTSLRYYHDALNALPENTPNIFLKGVILSQTGKLLADLRLYDEAMRYLEQLEPIVLKADNKVKVYHYELLGWVYMYQGRYSEAMECLDKAMEFGKTLPEGHNVRSRLSKALVYYEQDSILMALNTIRDIPNRIGPLSRNLALATAADIYRDAGYNDTAYMYARELIESDSPNNKKTGYRLILSPELQDMVPPDSLPYYYGAYKNILEDDFDENERDLVLVQQASYNYDLHQREKEKFALENMSLRQKLMIALLVIAALIIGIMVLLILRREMKLKLWRDIDIINQLKLKATLPEEASKPTILPEVRSSDLRERRRKELQELAEANPPHPHVDLLNSDVYSKLQTLIKAGKPIAVGSGLWDEMEQEVNRISPNFKATLMMLTNGHLKPTDYTTALLIKFGLTPTEMSVLLARAMSTISTRRDGLSKKIFDEKKPNKLIDSIILLL